MDTGWEDLHRQADLGEDRLGAVATDASDFVEAVDCGQVGRRPVTGGGGRGWWSLGGGDIGDDLLGPGVEPSDLGSEDVDLAEQNVGERDVMLVEAAGARLNECGILDPQPSFGQLGEYGSLALVERTGSTDRRPLWSAREGVVAAEDPRLRRTQAWPIVANLRALLQTPEPGAP